MSILDEREPTVSLKLIVIVVSLMTVVGFGALFMVNSQSSQSHAAEMQQTVAPAPQVRPTESANG